MHWRWLSFDALDPHTLHAILRLRAEVFVVEQACIYADVDGADPDAHHLIGQRDGQTEAVLRAFAPGVQRAEVVVGRVVVAPAARGAGLGDRLMHEGLAQIARQWPGHPVWLSAQAHLQPWYRRLGFEACGPGYDEDGIPHVPMCTKAVGIPSPAP